MADQVNPCHGNCINPWNYEGTSEAKGIAVAIIFFSALAVVVSLTSTLVSFGVHIQGLNALSVLSIYGKIGVMSATIVSLAIFAIAITWLITKTCCRPNFVNRDENRPPDQPPPPNRVMPPPEQPIVGEIRSVNLPLVNANNSDELSYQSLPPNRVMPPPEQPIVREIRSVNLPLLNADNNFARLSSIIKVHIFSLLNIKDRVLFASSCKIFNQYTNFLSLWKNEIKILDIQDANVLKSTNYLTSTISQKINILTMQKDKTACGLLRELFPFDLENELSQLPCNDLTGNLNQNRIIEQIDYPQKIEEIGEIFNSALECVDEVLLMETNSTFKSFSTQNSALAKPIMLLILSYLSKKDMLSFSLTCKSFNKLTESKILWEKEIRVLKIDDKIIEANPYKIRSIIGREIKCLLSLVKKVDDAAATQNYEVFDLYGDMIIFDGIDAMIKLKRLDLLKMIKIEQYENNIAKWHVRCGEYIRKKVKQSLVREWLEDGEFIKAKNIIGHIDYYSIYKMVICKHLEHNKLELAILEFDEFQARLHFSWDKPKLNACLGKILNYCCQHKKFMDFEAIIDSRVCKEKKMGYIILLFRSLLEENQMLEASNFYKKYAAMFKPWTESKATKLISSCSLQKILDKIINDGMLVVSAQDFVEKMLIEEGKFELVLQN